MLGFMLIQLASLKVGSMRTGYTASASFTSTASMGTVGRITPCAPSPVGGARLLTSQLAPSRRRSRFGGAGAGTLAPPGGAHGVTRSSGDPSSDLRLVTCPLSLTLSPDGGEGTSMRAVSSLPVASVTRNRL